MQVKKIGKIFDPTEYDLKNNCKEFSQSPQALVFEDFIRVYFSTRTIDAINGKYLSHIAFVDFDKGMSSIIRVSSGTVVPLGGLGCFDEHGIFPLNVLRHGDDIYGYTCGWSRRVSVSVETGVGLVISKDRGNSFRRVGDGPVLSSSLREPFLVGDAFVKIIDGTFHMWYIFGTLWKKRALDEPPERTYKIGHASSADGIDWKTEGGRQIVPDVIGKDESQALPSVIQIGNRLHMFFCYRETFDFRNKAGRGYRIGYAWSDDNLNWTREDGPILGSATEKWDSDMQCYPNVFECDGAYYLLYNGNQFGRYGFGLAQLEL